MLDERMKNEATALLKEIKELAAEQERITELLEEKKKAYKTLFFSPSHYFAAIDKDELISA